MKYKISECVKDLESAKKFCKLNSIVPTEIIVLWEEDYEDKNTNNKR